MRKSETTYRLFTILQQVEKQQSFNRPVGHDIANRDALTAEQVKSS